MSEKQPYKVLKPILFGGRREKGETVNLTDNEARNIGLDYVALIEQDEITNLVKADNAIAEGEYSEDEDEATASEDTKPKGRAKKKNK